MDRRPADTSPRMVNVPSSAATRSARPARPWPGGCVSAPPTPSSYTSTISRPAAAIERRRACSGVLDDVRQCLADEEVDAGLDRRRKALLGNLQRLDGDRDPVGQGLDCGEQSARGEKRRVDARGQLAQLVDAVFRLLRSAIEELPGAVGLGRPFLLGPLEIDHDVHELLLSAVVEVARTCRRAASAASMMRR